MQEMSIRDLSRRIEDLERQVTLFRRVARVSAVVAIAAIVIMGAAGPQKLTVKALRIDPGDGQGGVFIGPNDSGGVMVSVFSSKGRLGGTLGMTQTDMPYIGLYGQKNGEPFVQAFMAVEKGKPNLRLLDGDGESLFRAPN
jgi:hypothetical protein